MAAGYQELFLEQGTDYVTTITIDDVNGDPFDLTDYIGKGQMKKSYYSSSATANFVITITQPENGAVEIKLDSANTANIAAGRYVYDVVIKNSSNNVTRILEGIVNVLPQVTVF